MNRKRNTKKKIATPWWGWLLAVLGIWLLGSIYSQKSPVHTLTDFYRNLTGQSSEYKSPSEQKAETSMFTDSLDILQKKIQELENRSPYRRALVKTEANSLNLRASSNIASNVVVKIPDSSIVEVIYFDEEVLVLEGEPGKWCKVRYADKEGWVWGNYVELLD